MLLRSSLSSLRILITSVLSSVSDRLLIFILFSSFSGVLICCFIWAMFLCSFWQPPCVCFYVLGRAAGTPCLGSMAGCSTCPAGPSGTACTISQAGYLRFALCVGQVHLPLVVEAWLLLADQWERWTQASQLQGLSVTSDHQPPHSMEDQLCRGRMVVL